MLRKSFLALSQAAIITAQLGPAYNISSILSQHDELSTFTSYINQCPELLAQVAPGNFTILAPVNEAFSNFNNDTLEAVLSYHVLNGSLTRAKFNEDPQFLPTLLSDPKFANVTGGQRVEAVSSGSRVTFYSAVKAASNLLTADILYSGGETGVIHTIDKLLIPPLNEPNTVTEAKLNGFIEILVETPPSPQILGVVGPSPDWTIFGPNSTTFSITNVPLKAVYAYENYHFVHGEVAYTPDLTNGKKLKTVQGNDVTITVLNGSIYVNDQRIIAPNYLISTGVLHLIESNLNPNDTTARPGLNSTPPSAHPAPSSSSISTGAKAGIGIGAALGLFLLFGLGWFFIRRRRHQKTPHDAPVLKPSQPPHELDPRSVGERHEKDGTETWRHEKDSTQAMRPVELEGQHAF